MKVYNNGNRKFGLRNPETKELDYFIKPLDFAEVPAEYEGDITLRTALAAGELTAYESTKQADTIETKTRRRKTEEV